MVWRKFARSALLQVPKAYDFLGGTRRYELMRAVGTVHEPEFRVLPTLLHSDHPLVLDVGANVGQSILSLKTVLPHCRVISFEPNPAHHETLNRLAAGLDDVSLRTMGLGAQAGQLPFFVPRYKGRAMSGLASFDRDQVQDFLSKDDIYGFDPSHLVVEEFAARIERLDDLGLSPDLIKIDVQGLESDVIVGGHETIKRCRPVILAETVTADSRAMALLGPLGYRRLELQDGHLVDATDDRVNQILVPDGTM